MESRESIRPDFNSLFHSEHQYGLDSGRSEMFCLSDYLPQYSFTCVELAEAVLGTRVWL
jgi:hypothetical protein